MAPSNKQQLLTPKQALERAFETATRALSLDMPVLMHGSGGGDNNWETQKLVAALTVQYIQRLVEAAVDARDMLMHGTHDADVLPPPPPLVAKKHESRKPKARPSNNNNKRKLASEEFWDDPLPKPKIRGQQATNVNEEDEDKAEAWVGVAGVDLWEHSRARAAYVRGISAQQFIFPVCHDTYVYGRIREVQAAKLTVTEPLLQDVTVLDIVRVEGQLQQEEALRKRRRLRSTTKTKQKKANDGKKDSGNTSDADDDEDPEEAEADEEEEGPTWPGLDELLPAYRGIS